MVTGAARGIGDAVVHRLSWSGWQVVAVDRCADDSRVGYRLSTERELAAEAYPGTVAHVVADVRDRSALCEAVSFAESAFGHHQLIDRILEPDEVAAVVSWLCGTDSSAVNGTIIHADGGFIP